jgi:hypothetical protein
MPSFEAPTLLTESYQVNTAAARNREPTNTNFHDLNIVILLFTIILEMNNKVAPAIGMLVPVIIREDIPGIVVRNSTIIDSSESIIA